MKRGMWLLVDAGLARRQDFRDKLTIDDTFEAYQFLQAKRAAEAKQAAAMREAVPR